MACCYIDTDAGEFAGELATDHRPAAACGGRTRITRTGGSGPPPSADARQVAEELRAVQVPLPRVREVADRSGARAAGARAWPPRTVRELDVALDAGRLTVVYQPVICLSTGAVVAAESLVRLRVPGSRKLLAPDSFLPLAEDSGRIVRMDRMVLATAVPLAVSWRAQRPERPFSIGVNLSVVGLSDPGLPGFIQRTCDAAGLPYNALVIEVTETVLSAAGRGHEQVLRAIDELGCNVTLDDFGTGYSSLAHLSRFPVSGIKVDRRFIWDIGRPGRSGQIPAALVRLGQDLGLHVVAEGVETAEQLAALQGIACRFAQGYLISRPVPADELTAFLVARPQAPA